MSDLPTTLTPPSLDVGIKHSRLPSPIWLIPLLALCIAGWLLYQYWYQQGPSIQVPFVSAEGVVAGQTVVRYKHVVVGRVDKISLAQHPDRAELLPLIRMRLNTDIAPLINCQTQFWIVRPQIKGAEISGLSTLFSGAYIGLNPQPATQEASADTKNCYQTLEEAPPVIPDQAGRQFILEADSANSLNMGTPVFYKQLRVGEVIDYRLVQDTGKINIRIFVNEPYYQFINPETRFWNAGGLELKMGASGAELRMESLSSLLIGGIAFDTPIHSDEPLAVSAADSRFNLFKDYRSSQERLYKDKLYYLLYFEGSVRGLSVGAPVEYQGIPVGKVESIAMDMNPDTLAVRIPVRVAIETQRFAEDIDLIQAKRMMDNLVAKGIRAKLQSGNILTGQMFISLTKDDQAPPATIDVTALNAIFPTSPTPVEELTRMAVGIATDLKSTLSSIRAFMDSKQLDKTVANANELINDTSDLMQDARQAVADLRTVLQTLENNTLPKASQDLTRVANSLNKAIPRASQDLTSVANSLNKAIPQASQDLTSVINSVNKAIPSLTQNVSSVANNLNKAIPQVSQDVTSVANSVNKAIPSLTQNVTSVANSVNKALPQFNNDFKRVSDDFVVTMRKLQVSLTHMDRLMAQNSPTQYQLMEMMQEVTSAARSIRELSERLERKPDSLLRGRRE